MKHLTTYNGETEVTINVTDQPMVVTICDNGVASNVLLSFDANQNTMVTVPVTLTPNTSVSTYVEFSLDHDEYD